MKTRAFKNIKRIASERGFEILAVGALFVGVYLFARAYLFGCW